jgi:hypothetical protein
MPGLDPGICAFVAVPEDVDGIRTRLVPSSEKSKIGEPVPTGSLTSPAMTTSSSLTRVFPRSQGGAQMKSAPVIAGALSGFSVPIRGGRCRRTVSSGARGRAEFSAPDP